MRRTIRAVVTAVVTITMSLALAALVAGQPAAAESRHAARPLTVMSFNIHHAEGTDGVLDLARIAQVIKDNGADVVGLQEVDRHYSDRSDLADQPAELAALLGYHVVFGANIDRDPPAPGQPRIQYGTAILSRYPITAWQNVQLYNTPPQEQRGLLHARIDVRGTAMDFYCTHLAASSQTDRIQQSRQIVDLIGKRDPAILVGDFNATPDAPEIGTLQAAYTDVWQVAGHGDDSTYSAEDPNKRIDMIFATDRVQPIRAKVVTSDPVASDHLPVISRVIIRG